MVAVKWKMYNFRISNYFIVQIMGYKNFRKTSIYFVLPLFSRILMGKWEGWIKKSEKEEFHMGKLMEGRFQDGVNNNSSRFVKKKL